MSTREPAAPAGLFAGRNAVRGSYLRLLAQVAVFHRHARRVLSSGSQPAYTLRQFLDDGPYTTYFDSHFVIPLVSAVWSCAPETAMQYPAPYRFRFLDHRGLLSVKGSPQWKTVTGGSVEYVDRIAKQLTTVHTGTPVRAVQRFAERARVTTEDGDTQEYAAVVIAVHPDQALRLLTDPTEDEQRVLGAFRYCRSPTVLHTDTTLLPRSTAARASWNYFMPSCEAPADAVQVSYLRRRTAPQDRPAARPGRRRTGHPSAGNRHRVGGAGTAGRRARRSGDDGDALRRTT
ncbi:hypothetical protein GCM10010353_68280 [Streptomyces chryseus]|nr:hypothetical protein GCM10010353_68280 [Streptomyces chryseus]